MNYFCIDFRVIASAVKQSTKSLIILHYGLLRCARDDAIFICSEDQIFFEIDFN